MARPAPTDASIQGQGSDSLVSDSLVSDIFASNSFASGTAERAAP
ncbi:hypothetical protein NZK27_00855 [Synechococcus sp. FGCU-3]|nr:hypothetical protein [Synechococcus sp. FGCU3]